jgi:phosphonate transport system substrate-binding protein
MKLASLAFLTLIAGLAGSPPAGAEPTVIAFGIISTEASAALKQQWAPILADMEARTGLTVTPFFASDYAGVIEAMRFDKVQVAYFGNKSAMEAVDRADGQIFAQVVQANGTPGYYSVLITHKDTDIHSLDDVLKNPGKYNFANGDPNSTSGFLVPGYYVFAKNHIDPKTHFKRVMSGSHETNIMAVLNKQVDLATNNTNDLEKLGHQLGERISDIRVVWTSPLIPADPLVWRKDLPADVKARVSGFFLGYARSGTEADRLRERKNLAPLTFSGFKPSSDDQLLPIRQLELFKTRAKLAAEEGLSETDKAARLAEIDGRLAELQKKTASAD